MKDTYQTSKLTATVLFLRECCVPLLCDAVSSLVSLLLVSSCGNINAFFFCAKLCEYRCVSYEGWGKLIAEQEKLCLLYPKHRPLSKPPFLPVHTRSNQF